MFVTVQSIQGLSEWKEHRSIAVNVLSRLMREKSRRSVQGRGMRAKENQGEEGSAGETAKQYLLGC